MTKSFQMLLFLHFLSLFTSRLKWRNLFRRSKENDVTNCWVPIFDQGALQSRDPNMAQVMPVTYQPTAASPYNGPTTLYQSPVVYSAEQFPNQPAQVAQYPMSYPMGNAMYATYPVNGEDFRFVCLVEALMTRF
jgi:hypothetical protein